MKTVNLSTLALVAVLSVSAVYAQSSSNMLPVGTTLPIQFERSIDSNHAQVGETVVAKTSQRVQLANGLLLPAGSRVTGHVVTARGFSFDKTPYAKQATSTLAIQFESVEEKGQNYPLHVYVRAMAGPISVWDSEQPQPSDMDSLSTRTQIGGDLVVPSQDAVTSQDGDVVGYLRRGGVYAHLISAMSNGPSNCDATDTEQAMGPFSAAACGLYGYGAMTLSENGKNGGDATLTLASRRQAAKIWAKSAALLEVIDDPSARTAQ